MGQYLSAVTSFNKEVTLSVFIDFSKAFDRISHNILFHKLDRYGIRGTALNWFISYLTDRSFYVNCNDVNSAIKLTDGLGVPQGSILGPILFLVYINDLPSCLTHSKSVLYADDTTLYLSGISPDALANTMNSELGDLEKWCKINGLTINPDKTKYMLLSHKKSNTSIKLLLNKKSISRVSNFKFLGVHIDENLSWATHLHHLKIKLGQGVYVLNRVKNCMPQSVRLMLYYSLIHSHMSYGCILWGNFLNNMQNQ